MLPDRLNAEHDPVRAIGLFEDIRLFTQKSWELALPVH
jgi:hypothetical protein